MTDARWREICARRLERQALLAPLAGASPARIVGAMCGAHAQVLTAAEWSVGLRGSGLVRADVRHALWTERSLVKTFGPRGTVHLLPAEDLPMWTGALSAFPSALYALPEGVRLSPGQTESVVGAIEDALGDAELTLGELGEAVVARTGSWAGELVMPAFNGMWPRWRQALPLAGMRGALCFGPSRGRNVTYTGPRRWLPGFRPEDPEAALAELVRRYLYAYGPATPAHFGQWLGAPRRWAEKLFESLAANLRPAELAGSMAWLAAADAAIPHAVPDGVRLLPYFDAYAVACQPRGLMFPGDAAERARGRNGQAGNFPVLLVDGVVRGIWHQRLAGRHVTVVVEPFIRLTKRHLAELDAQADGLGAFLGAVPQLTIGAVPVGRHA